MGKTGAEENPDVAQGEGVGWGWGFHFNEASTEERGRLPGQKAARPRDDAPRSGIKAALGIIPWELCNSAGPTTLELPTGPA